MKNYSWRRSVAENIGEDATLVSRESHLCQLVYSGKSMQRRSSADYAPLQSPHSRPHSSSDRQSFYETHLCGSRDAFRAVHFVWRSVKIVLRLIYYDR
ncbi:hypothetical protein EVAR_42446_1 [Eumeta japonica]|uniref:Uncharacterized protein n=1 Tax=Eumeta variegata TaxID=151549 RepID=A0A4C1Y274_EUMVA|nr:hypothetical protein EVAR_42446_1 [Eumeta japonica]